jgi:hypothetical protein
MAVFGKLNIMVLEPNPVNSRGRLFLLGEAIWRKVEVCSNNENWKVMIVEEAQELKSIYRNKLVDILKCTVSVLILPH